jgi:EAL domain-containing protein (putative c-di-GMP-specific phosphodiesterase class I)
MTDDSGSFPAALGGQTAAPGSPAPTGTRHTVWFLVGRLFPEEPVRHLPVHSSPYPVGRRADASLCLPSRAVSSLHAELIDHGNRLAVRDLGSTNGTYVNGQRVVGEVELDQDDLVQFADVPFRVLKQTSWAGAATANEDVFDMAMALVQFDRLLNERVVIPHYHAIVGMSDENVVGFEVLARSRIPGLEMPAAMFSAAVQLNMEVQLSETIRWQSIQQTMTLANPPHLFLNTHPAELREPGLIDSIRGIRELSPGQRITLEIHEKSIVDGQAMKEIRSALRDLDVGLAFDDFGAGQARLLELADVSPDYLKFDMSLIRSIHRASAEHRRMVAALVQMVREMDVVSVAEGIETVEERDVCLEMGFELAQGFLFGKPAPLAHGSSALVHEIEHRAPAPGRMDGPFA